MGVYVYLGFISAYDFGWCLSGCSVVRKILLLGVLRIYRERCIEKRDILALYQIFDIAVTVNKS